MSQPTHTITASVGTYTDKDGKERKQFRHIGAGWWDAQEQKLTMKIEMIPMQPDGYITAFRVDEKS